MANKEMPPPLPDTYAGAVDQDTRMFVRAAIWHALKKEMEDVACYYRDLERQMQTLRDDNKTLTGLIVELRQEVTDLKRTQTVDDKYVLTRQKIIDFMKREGIK